MISTQLFSRYEWIYSCSNPRSHVGIDIGDSIKGVGLIFLMNNWVYSQKSAFRLFRVNSILLSHPEQQDTVQRVNQAYAPGNSPMRMDQHAPTFPLWHRNVSPDCVKCFKERLGPVKDPYIGHIIAHWSLYTMLWHSETEYLASSQINLQTRDYLPMMQKCLT